MCCEKSYFTYNTMLQSAHAIFYADTALKVSYAEVCHIVNKTIWASKCKIDLNVKIPYKGLPNMSQATMDLFCFPEFNNLQPSIYQLCHYNKHSTVYWTSAVCCSRHPHNNVGIFVRAVRVKPIV